MQQSSAGKKYNFTKEEFILKGFHEEWLAEEALAEGYDAYDWYGKVYCAETHCELRADEVKGAVEVLWNIFGGTMTDKGFKMLSQYVGLIYGDSITIPRAASILARLKEKGFASGNVVFGIGSYTYQYLTRDTLGWAMKATHGVVGAVGRDIFKDPVTDIGKTKKSAKGLLRVEFEDGNYVLYDQQTPEQEKLGELKTVLLDGKFPNLTTWQEIRARLGVLKLNV
jgi:nicotinamide phosphoribosyltransferase